MIHLPTLAAASALLVLLASLTVIGGCAQGQAQAPDDAALVLRGQRLYLRCASCHDVAGSAIVKNGPSLQGVVGRKVAGVNGYGYSKSLASLTFTWDEARLDQWLEQPTAVAPGTTMAFEGMTNAAERKAVIAYLRAQRP
jgi:cytochrome c